MAKSAAKKKPVKKAQVKKTAKVKKAGPKVPLLSDRIRGRQVPHIGMLSGSEVQEIIALGEWFRDHPLHPAYSDLLKGRVQALLFVYESTRTRLGFETAMAQLGGSNVYLAAKDTQMGRGESVADTARAIGQFVNLFSGRLWKQDDIETVCKNLDIPVLNACTPQDHSTHVIGELMAIKQAMGRLEGLNLVYTGMARAILHSFVRVCPLLGINLTLALPQSYVGTLVKDIMAEGEASAKTAGTRLDICTDLRQAMKGADFIQASTLIRSMLAGEQSPEEKEVEVAKWTMSTEILNLAKPGALYSHSGPAHRGVCATDELMDGPRSIIPAEAHNAIYSKKAMMALMVR